MASNIETLIRDAVNVLDLKPSAKYPLSKYDIHRVADLIGKEITEERATECVNYLLSRRALGSRFRVNYLIEWWTNQTEPIMQSFDHENRIKVRSHNSKTPRNRSVPARISLPPLRKDLSKLKVTEICQILMDKLDNIEPNPNVALVEDGCIRRLITECIEHLKRNRKAQDYLQQAFELTMEDARKEQGMLGELSSNLSRMRLYMTKKQRREQLEKDVDFLMRNQGNCNIGTALYFLLSPAVEPKPKPKKSVLKPKQAKRLREILENGVS